MIEKSSNVFCCSAVVARVGVLTARILLGGRSTTVYSGGLMRKWIRHVSLCYKKVFETQQVVSWSCASLEFWNAAALVHLSGHPFLSDAQDIQALNLCFYLFDSVLYHGLPAGEVDKERLARLKRRHDDVLQNTMHRLELWDIHIAKVCSSNPFMLLSYDPSDASTC
jgi:hypothetical protein